jgi:hypothetical protein
MLMIVVTIIVAAVVAAFAANTDITKRAGPSATLSSEILYSTEGQIVSASWNTPDQYHDAQHYDALNCNEDFSNPACNAWYAAHADQCDESYDNYYGWGDDGESSIYYMNDTYYTDPSTGCISDPVDVPFYYDNPYSKTKLANKDGLLFTNIGGDPIDLKDLEMTVRYYNLAATVYFSDTKNYAPTIPSDAVNIAGPVDVFNSGGNKYFVKVNPTSADDTIIRPGDQFVFLVDHLDKNNQFDPTAWALSSTRSDGNYGASIGINTRTGQMEWWLTHSPSGNTLAHGKFEIPNT